MRRSRFRYTRHDYERIQANTLGVLLSNEIVVDRPNTHAHLIGPDLEAALLLVDAKGRDYLVEEVDCGRHIGEAKCVATKPSDAIGYAYRHGREGPTRFVLGRTPEPTTHATVVLKRSEKPGIMLLISAWAGPKSELEPWDEQLRGNETALAQSQAFWDTHALVFDPDEIDFSRPFGTAEEMAEHLV